MDATKPFADGDARFTLQLLETHDRTVTLSVIMASTMLIKYLWFLYSSLSADTLCWLPTFRFISIEINTVNPVANTIHKNAIFSVCSFLPCWVAKFHSHCLSNLPAKASHTSSLLAGAGCGVVIMVHVTKFGMNDIHTNHVAVRPNMRQSLRWHVDASPIGCWWLAGWWWQ